MSVIFVPIRQNASNTCASVWLIASVCSAASGGESQQRTGAVARSICASRRTTPEASHCSTRLCSRSKRHHTLRWASAEWMTSSSFFLCASGGGLTYLSLNLDRLFLSCSSVAADRISVCLYPFLSAFTKYPPIPLCLAISFALSPSLNVSFPASSPFNP